jgi:hypothetical protein
LDIRSPADRQSIVSRLDQRARQSMSLPSFCVDSDAVLKDVTSDIRWRSALPNYEKANALFQKCKSTDHQSGSVQWLVQNLVKNWEKGASRSRFPVSV